MVEYQGPERRKGAPATELMAVALSIEKLANSVESNMSEERLQGIVAGEQKRDRKRLVVVMAAFGVVLLVVSIFGLAQSRANHSQGQRIERTAKDAAVVADYVRDCLQTPSAQRNPQKCGSDGGATLIKGLVDYMNCAFLILPDERTEVNLTACALKGLGGTSK